MTPARRFFACVTLVLVGAAPVFILVWDEQPHPVGFGVALLSWIAIAFGVACSDAFKRAERSQAFTYAIRTSVVTALLVSILPPFWLDKLVGSAALNLMEKNDYIEWWFDSSGPRLNTFSAALMFGWLIEIPKALAFCVFTAFASFAFRLSPPRAARVFPEICSRCGYDLRASPERCPECGTPRPDVPTPPEPDGG